MIEGYPETASVLPGETLVLCISTDHPWFRVDFYRQGASLELVGNNQWHDGAAFARGSPDQDWGWGRHEFIVPDAWTPGVYVAMFFELDGQGNVVSGPEDATIADGRVAKALFVIRNGDLKQVPPILYKISLFTYQAYNETSMGGSLYTGAEKVTLRRVGGGTGGNPFDIGVPDAYDGSSPRQTFAHWDVPFIRWLEQNGYAVDYCTDLDIHQNPGSFLGSYRLLLSVGHDEYWSPEMRANVAAFVQNGGNFACFSGNTCWWRIQLSENDTAFARIDHWPDDDRETKLTGVSYRHAGGWWDGERELVGYTVQHANHWIFRGTGLQDGQTLGTDQALVGYECDGTLLSDQTGGQGLALPAFSDGTPSRFEILGVGRLGPRWIPATQPSDQTIATMGIYTDRGTVFTAATVDWARVLAGGQDPGVDRITRNVIDRLQRHDIGIGLLPLLLAV